MTTISDKLVNKQNMNLQYQLRKIKDQYSTDDQKNNYERQKIYDTKYTVNLLFFLYYILALITMYFLYKSDYFSTYMKLFIIVILGVYPFVISTIEYVLYDIFYYLYSFVYSIPYKSKLLHS